MRSHRLGAEFEDANRRWESVCLQLLCWHFVAHLNDQVIDNRHHDHCLATRALQMDGGVGSATTSRAAGSNPAGGTTAGGTTFRQGQRRIRRVLPYVEPIRTTGRTTVGLPSAH